MVCFIPWHTPQNWQWGTKDKRDDFNFPIVKFPFICSNIPAAPVYGVNISQLLRYSRACGSYQDFLERGMLLTRVLLNQGFLLVKLKSSLRKFYGRHHDLVDRHGIFLSQNDHGYVTLVVSTSRFILHSWLITESVARITRRMPLMEQELPTLPEHLSSPPVFSGVRVTRSFVLCVCSLSFWPLCCLFFFHLRILITTLVSSNSFYI